MNEALLMSVVVGLVAGALALGIGSLAIRLFSDSQIKNIDLDRKFEQLNALKRDMVEEDVTGAYSTGVTAPTALLYGLFVTMILAAAFRTALFLSSDFRVVAIASFLVWLFLLILPVGKVITQRAKQLVTVEIALILEQIAHSEQETGEAWSIRASKKVSGGDLLGEDEEDRLEFDLTRTSEMPVTLTAKGQVCVAEAGLGRTIKKAGLRQLRLQGWFVNEIDDTHADIEVKWNLHDHTYAHIAHDLTKMTEALGFSVRNIRLSRIESDVPDKTGLASHLRQSPQESVVVNED